MSKDTRREAFSAALRWVTMVANDKEREALAMVLAVTTPVARPKLKRSSPRIVGPPSRVVSGRPYRPEGWQQRWWELLKKSKTPMSPLQLATAIGKPASSKTVSGTLSQLYTRGFVTRERAGTGYAYLFKGTSS